MLVWASLLTEGNIVMIESNTQVHNLVQPHNNHKMPDIYIFSLRMQLHI